VGIPSTFLFARDIFDWTIETGANGASRHAAGEALEKLMF
jgi:hypothetical protein